MNPRLPLDHYEAALNDLAGLYVFFAYRWAQEHPDEDFRHVLRERVDLCRMVDPVPQDYDMAERNPEHPVWLRLEEQLCGVREAADSAAEFEQVAKRYIQPVVCQFARASHGSTVKYRHYGGHALRFDPPKAENPTSVEFHIYNPLSPRSIFDDPGYLPGEFMRLMDEAESGVGATHLHTYTWLNSLPRWLACFPSEWMDHLGEPDPEVSWHLGFWGQFINAEGRLNERAALALRTTGTLPMLPRSSHCSFAALRAHVQQWC